MAVLKRSMASALRRHAPPPSGRPAARHSRTAMRTRWPRRRRMRAQRDAATRLPVRLVGPSGVIRTIFMDHGHATHRRPTSGASAAELVAQLREARQRTRRLTEDLSSTELMGPYLEIVNPVLWEIGHIAWFHEYWTLRQAAGRAPLIERGDCAVGLEQRCARDALAARPARPRRHARLHGRRADAPGRPARPRRRRRHALFLRARRSATRTCMSRR